MTASNLLAMLRKPNGRLSWAIISVIVSHVLWWFTWLFSLFTGKTFAHFDVVTIAVWTAFFVVMVRNSVETKLFSIKVGEDKQC